MQLLNEVQKEIESKIDSATGAARYFKEKDISTLSDKDLLHLLGRMVEVNLKYQLDTYINLVRDEFADRRQVKMHKDNRTLTVLAVIASGFAAIATIIQAFVAVVQFCSR